MERVTMIASLPLIFATLLLSACQSTSSFAEMWQNTWHSDDQEVLMVRAIDEGGEVFLRQSKLLQEPPPSPAHFLADAERRLVSLFHSNAAHWNQAQLLRATRLYGLTEQKHSSLVFSAILRSSAEESYSLAWQLLSTTPLRQQELESNRAFVDGILSQALRQGNIQQHFVPEMAQVIQAWQVRSVYSVLRMALFKKGDPEFVHAMIHLKPRDCSEDLMNYLALVPPEDLRQLSLNSIRSSSAQAILEHFAQHPPSFGHPHIGKLFAYGASRQTTLKNLALKVIDQLTPEGAMLMAYSLMQQPPWVQMAIITEGGRQSTPQRLLLLRHLAQITPDENIAAEIALLEP